MGSPEMKSNLLSDFNNQINNEYFKYISTLQTRQEQRIFEDRLEQVQQSLQQMQQQQIQNERFAWLSTVGTGVTNIASSFGGQYLAHYLTLRQQQHTASLNGWGSALNSGLNLAVRGAVAAGGLVIQKYL